MRLSVCSIASCVRVDLANFFTAHRVSIALRLDGWFSYRHKGNSTIRWRHHGRHIHIWTNFFADCPQFQIPICKYALLYIFGWFGGGWDNICNNANWLLVCPMLVTSFILTIIPISSPFGENTETVYYAYAWYTHVRGEHNKLIAIAKDTRNRICIMRERVRVLAHAHTLLKFHRLAEPLLPMTDDTKPSIKFLPYKPHTRWMIDDGLFQKLNC